VVQLLSGTGTFWLAVSPAGAIQVAYSGSASVSCTRCTLMPNAFGFPVESLPLWQWTASVERRWDSGAGTDFRALLGRDVNTYAGSGIVLATDPATGARTFQLDTAFLNTAIRDSRTPVLSSVDDLVVELNDDFLTRPGATFGTLGWSQGNLSGSAFHAEIGSDSTERGYLRLTTDASGSSGTVSEGGVYLRSAPDNDAGHTGIGLAQPAWSCRFHIRSTDPGSGGAVRTGFFRNQRDVSAGALYVQSQPVAGGFTWALFSGNTRLLTSVITVLPGSWHWITISSQTAGTVALKVDNEAWQTASTTIPVAPMAPGISYVLPAGSWSAAQNVDIGKWMFRTTGVF
jgi:hypothetical protein